MLPSFKQRGEKGCAFENERRLAQRERVPFHRGGRTSALNVANVFLEYVGVNREIDRKMGSLKSEIYRKMRLTPFHLGQSPVATLATRALRLSFFPPR